MKVSVVLLNIGAGHNYGYQIQLFDQSRILITLWSSSLILVCKKMPLPLENIIPLFILFFQYSQMCIPF